MDHSDDDWLGKHKLLHPLEIATDKAVSNRIFDSFSKKLHSYITNFFATYVLCESNARLLYSSEVVGRWSWKSILDVGIHDLRFVRAYSCRQQRHLKLGNDCGFD